MGKEYEKYFLEENESIPLKKRKKWHYALMFGFLALSIVSIIIFSPYFMILGGAF